MEGTIHIEYPESLANALRLSSKDFAYEIKVVSLVKLYEIGRVSSGTAAKALGLSRIAFLDILSTYNVSVLGDYDAENLTEDLSNA
jgi:predicted HTH domain antitoxin